MDIRTADSRAADSRTAWHRRQGSQAHSRMPSPERRWLASAARSFFLSCLTFLTLPFALFSRPAIEIERFGNGSALQRAGAEVGDQFWAWKQILPDGSLSEGRIETYLDWFEARLERGPRSGLRLIGGRGEQELELEIGPGPWNVVVRPLLPGDLAADYAAVSQRIPEDPQAVLEWRPWIARLAERGEIGLAAWLTVRAARQADEAGQWQQAIDLYLEGLRHLDARRARRPVLSLGGRLMIHRRFLDEADEALTRAVREDEAAGDDSLTATDSLYLLAHVDMEKNRLPQARERLERCLERYRGAARRSLPVARTLDGLANIAILSGERPTAGRLFAEAARILRAQGIESFALAATLLNLGGIRAELGDFRLAHEYFLEANRIQENLSIGGLMAAMIANNLGIIAVERKDLDAAADYFRQALQMKQELGPDPTFQSTTLSNLGKVAKNRQLWDAALEYFQRALAIELEREPRSDRVVGMRNQIAHLELQRGRLAAAREQLDQSMEIREAVPGSAVIYATTHSTLAELIQAEQGAAAALPEFRRAWKVLQTEDTSGSIAANFLYKLAHCLRATGQREEAAAHYERAILALEGQAERLAGPAELRAHFHAHFAPIFQEYAELLVELGRPEAAFRVQEQARARNLLEMIAERKLLLEGDLPAELVAADREVAVGFQRVSRELAALEPGSSDPAAEDGERKRLRDERLALRRRQDEIVDEMRRSAPRVAALRYPRPLELAEIRRRLDPGTVVLSYAVGEDTTLIFVLTAEGGVRVTHREVGTAALAEWVERFHRLVRESREPDSRLGARRTASLDQLSAQLYDELVAPAEGLIETGERLLILPHGPLHELPFGALLRRGSEAEPDGKQYLVEWKPLHFALSATLYAELAEDASPVAEGTRSLSLVAFGAPRFPTDLPLAEPARIPNPEVRAIAERGFDFQPLPGARQEVETIRNLFPQSQAYLGAEATEARLKALPPGIRLVHLATHAFFDEQLPLDSGLILSIPEGLDDSHDNGILQLWEVFEEVQLEADLVVLSGCETGLGKPVPGEGLIGLARAFQFAGARAVIASSWPVPDRSTSRLMGRLYHHLAQGLSKDEALRAAQVEMIRGGREGSGGESSPYHWAAFQLNGHPGGIAPSSASISERPATVATSFLRAKK